MSSHLIYRGLPLEVREMIYLEIFRAPEGIMIEVASNFQGIMPDVNQPVSYRAQAGLTAAILRTNRQTFEECLPFLYSKNQFEFTVKGPYHVLRFLNQLSPTSRQLLRYIRVTAAMTCSNFYPDVCDQTHTSYVNFILNTLKLDTLEILHNPYDYIHGLSANGRGCFHRTIRLFAAAVGSRRIKCVTLITQTLKAPELASWYCLQLESLDRDWQERKKMEVGRCLALGRVCLNSLSIVNTITKSRPPAGRVGDRWHVHREEDEVIGDFEPGQQEELEASIAKITRMIERVRKQRLEAAKWMTVFDEDYAVNGCPEQWGRVKVSIVPYNKQPEKDS